MGVGKGDRPFGRRLKLVNSEAAYWSMYVPRVSGFFFHPQGLLLLFTPSLASIDRIKTRRQVPHAELEHSQLIYRKQKQVLKRSLSLCLSRQSGKMEGGLERQNVQQQRLKYHQSRTA